MVVEYGFAEDLQKRLRNPELKKAYDELEPEFSLIQKLIDEKKEETAMERFTEKNVKICVK